MKIFFPLKKYFSFSKENIFSYEELSKKKVVSVHSETKNGVQLLNEGLGTGGTFFHQVLWYTEPYEKIRSHSGILDSLPTMIPFWISKIIARFGNKKAVRVPILNTFFPRAASKNVRLDLDFFLWLGIIN